MIPEFPKFKRLEITDRADVEKITSRFPPYSDFNFTSMWCWDIENDISLSLLNGNLVVEFSDYITRNNFYSFLGINSVDETVQRIIELVQKKRISDSLKLVGGVSASLVRDNRFIVQEDPDNFDYILSIPRLMTYPSNSLRGKRNFLHRFIKGYQSQTKLLDIFDPKNKKRILERFFLWADQKNLGIDETKNEFTALSRLLDQKLPIELICVGVFVDEELIGFSISEIVGRGHALLHFEKCDVVSYVGVYPYIMQKTASILAQRNCSYMNYEQDLGIPGLRKAKLSYGPVLFLKKYTIMSVVAR